MKHKLFQKWKNRVFHTPPIWSHQIQQAFTTGGGFAVGRTFKRQMMPLEDNDTKVCGNTTRTLVSRSEMVSGIWSLKKPIRRIRGGNLLVDLTHKLTKVLYHIPKTWHGMGIDQIIFWNRHGFARLLEIKKLREAKNASLDMLSQLTHCFWCPGEGCGFRCPGRSGANQGQLCFDTRLVFSILKKSFRLIPPPKFKQEKTKFIILNSCLGTGKNNSGWIIGDFHASLDLSTRFSASNVPKRKPITSLFGWRKHQLATHKPKE